jgi:hypothetical protein|tara:strand:+ start:912 stop:1313 length:402 start_codon:yes stop_codon:yes gene_type:complete
MKLRKLTDQDWDTLCKWWEAWPKWVNPPKSFLPDNGKGGFIVEKNNKPICAGFIYLTNSDAVLLEWIVSDPEYRENDRKEALELLITGAEAACKAIGKKHMFSIGRNKHLIETHKELGWAVDTSSSYELTKNI